MSARQPFVPSRPASRSLNLSEETRNEVFAHAVSSNNNNTTSTEKKNLNHPDLEGPTPRPLNISGFKKSVSSSTSFNTGAGHTADPGSDAGTTHTQNQNQNQNLNQAHRDGSGGTGLLTRSKSSGVKSSTAPRIYAPRPYTPGPPAAAMMTPGSVPSMGFPAPEFKTPSLPFATAKSVTDEAAGGGAAQAHTSGLGRRTTSSSSSSTTRRQSFFGAAHEQFSFDDAGGGHNNNLDDDSGYYSSVSGQIETDDNEGAPPTNRMQNQNGAAVAVRRPPSVVSNEVPGQQVARGGVNSRGTGVNPDLEASFANLTKRIRPGSPGDIALVGARPRESELSKRPCIRPSHSPLPRESHRSLSRATATPLENASHGETETSMLPHNVPHQTATIEGFPGLEFSEDDMGRYAELYEKGSERWSRSTMEEWLAGANDIMAKFTEIMDMIKEHMSSKVNLYKSLHTKLADEHSSLDQRANELRNASQGLVRDSGNIGGGLDSNNLDVFIC